MEALLLAGFMECRMEIKKLNPKSYIQIISQFDADEFGNQMHVLSTDREKTNWVICSSNDTSAKIYPTYRIIS